LQLEVHPEAIAEAREARLWYAERSADAADAFMVELDLALDRIVEAPMRWPVRSGARRYVMRRFPFVVVYRIVGSTVEVVAVAHGRRKPGYWKSR
jgi:plasmid stabilization system protein ParE